MKTEAMTEFMRARGWRVRVVFHMKKARAVISADPATLLVVAQWFKILAPAQMEFVFKPLSLWQRWRLRAKQVEVKVKGLVLS